MNAGGFTSYEFVTGTSMEPTMHTGDLAVFMVPEQYVRGDIVAYHPVQAPDGAFSPGPAPSRCVRAPGGWPNPDRDPRPG